MKDKKQAKIEHEIGNVFVKNKMTIHDVLDVLVAMYLMELILSMPEELDVDSKIGAVENIIESLKEVARNWIKRQMEQKKDV